MDEIYVLCIILLPDMGSDGQKHYWCFIVLTGAKCGKCQTELLCARKYRCCQEFRQAIERLGFEGLNVQCITDHNDYDAMTNRAVLLMLVLLLKILMGRDTEGHP